jgi:hypothetical protein
MSQAEGAARVGVAQRTGSYWESASGRDRGDSEASLDLRIKVPKKLRRRLYERVSSGETIEQVAADLGISSRHLRRIVREVESAQTRSTASPDALCLATDDRYAVHVGDLSILDNLIPDGSAHLFLSDPPWDADSVHLYSRLAELASRKLVPGGLCVAFTGKYHLHEALARMLEHLGYYWLFAFELSDRHPVAWDKRIWSAWRPLIVGQRRDGDGGRRGEWLLDLLPSGRMDKRHHAWQQSLSPVAYLVEKLTQPGDLVVDPLCGSGTTGVACKLLGRRFIASEINPETAALARERIRLAEQECTEKLGS